VFQRTSANGNQATGDIEDASVPPASGGISLTYDQATDTVTLTPNQGGPVTYCGPQSPAGYCGA
jgi:hypothetical protein